MATQIEPTTPDEETEELNSVSDALINGKSVNAALMRLVTVYGGAAESSDTNAQLIDKLVDLAGGGGSSDADVFWVNFTASTTENHWIADKTFDEIFEAEDEWKTVKGKIQPLGLILNFDSRIHGFRDDMVMDRGGSGITTISYSRLVPADGDNDYEWEELSLVGLFVPIPETSDVGKVLMAGPNTVYWESLDISDAE